MLETHIIPVTDDSEGEDKFIIYRPLLGLAFVGNRAMANLAMNLSEMDYPSDDHLEDEAIQFLKGVGFFLPDNPPSKPETSLSSTVLLMTNQCQLRCTYCYAAAGEFTPKVLNTETALAAINYACAQAMQEGKQTLLLEFHGGGEPTLGWKTIQESVKHARSLPIPAKISITTNAMWLKEQCEWLIANMDGMTISMDGGKETQDRNRPISSGKPSSPIVMRNIKTLDDKGFRYGIRMTAVRPWNSLPENVKFILDNTACRNIQVEPAFNSARGQHDSGSTEDQNSFIEAFEEAYLIARSYKAELQFPGARPGLVTHNFCTAPYQALIVNPDNQITTCYEVSNSSHPLYNYSMFGQVENNQDIHLIPGAREKLHALIAKRQDQCRQCFCRWSCAGDCYVRMFEISSNGQVVFGGRCSMNQELTAFVLLDMISEAGGVWQRFARKSPEEEFPYG
ncbi:MAG TPA: radical SAM protein [Bacteroidales bacterium]|nr:radical SAM protein [Bacteroidales bacterium]